MTQQARKKMRLVEKRFLRVYSAWQETHRLELADKWLKLFGQLLKLNPAYSARRPFEGAF